MSSSSTNLTDMKLADGRYPREAYEFLCHALAQTQKDLERPAAEDPESADETHHVSARELLDGIRRFALDQFGMMAATVFRQWNISRTDDFGDMVYRLIDHGFWHRSDDDHPDDFSNVYEFDKVFVDEFVFDASEFDV